MVSGMRRTTAALLVMVPGAAVVVTLLALGLLDISRDAEVAVLAVVTVGSILAVGAIVIGRRPRG
jgi:uncharacterized membrane protein YjjB (DUF3815 family)